MATYTIKYALNGGSGSFSDQTANQGTSTTIHAGTPTKTSYTFVRWDSSTGTIYSPNSTFNENKTVTLTAAWTYTPAGFVPVTSVQINSKPSTLTLEKGNTAAYTCTVSPSNATDKTVIWTPRLDINDEVNVSSTGTVTAKGVGSAVVTVRSNANNSKFDSFNVNVIPINITNIISGYESTYSGKYWNAGLTQSSLSKTNWGTTSSGCGSNNCTSNEFGSAWQCAGFAFFMAKVVFGTIITNSDVAGASHGATIGGGWTVYKTSAPSTLAPGDIIRKSGHSAMVWKIESSTNVKVIEVWGSVGCKIAFGNYNGSISATTISSLLSSFEYVLKAPN